MLLSNADIISELLQQHKILGKVNDDLVNQQFFADSQCPYIEYVPWMVEYHTAYLNYNSCKAENFSIVFFEGKKQCALLNFSIFESAQGDISILSNASGLLPPYLHPSLTRKQKRKYLRKAFDLYVSMAKRFNVKQLRFQTIFVSGESEGWLSILQKYGVPKFSQELFCDLTIDQTLYLQLIREKYKKHIRDGNRLWQAEILTAVTEQQFTEIKQLHLDVVGFQTRSDLTWQLLRDAINNHDAFAVTVFDAGRLIGAAIFSFTKDIAVYSMGVYDRSLFDKPVSHIVHAKAIEYMKSLGLKEYHLGARCNANEWMQPSIKESQIGYFKEGFMTHSKFKVTFDFLIAELDQ